MFDALLSLIITATLLLGSPGPVPIALATAPLSLKRPCPRPLTILATAGREFR